MKPFDPYIATNQPRLRLGARVPPDGVNVAFTASPPYSAGQVEVIDLSARLAENAEHIHQLKGQMFADGKGLLRDEQGRYIIPSENVLVTNAYLLADDQYVPLFYQSLSRFYHYEIDPLIDEEGRYHGQHVYVADARGPIEEPLEIRLLATGTEHVWRVQVLGSFQNTPGRTFRLFYTRSDAHGETRDPDHREVMNPTPLFERKLPSEFDFNQPDPLTYAVAVDLQEMGYQVHVPEQSQLISRDPLWIRWRVHHAATDKTSPWFSETLFKQESLHPEEYVQRGQIVYRDEISRAYKTLHPDLRALMGTSGGEYTLEYEVWSDDAWQEDNDGWVQLRVADGPGGASRLEAALVGDRATGTADDSSALRGLESEFIPFALEIEGWENREAQGPKTLWHEVSRQAIATSNLNTGLFPDYTNVANVTKGAVNPLGGESVLESPQEFRAYSHESTNPPTTTTDITVTLDEPRELSILAIDMGPRGSIERLQVEYQSQTTTLWNNGHVPPPEKITAGFPLLSSITIQRYLHEFGSPTMVEKIHLRVKPSRWYTRTTWDEIWAIFRISWNYQDWYKSGFSVMNIGAWEKEIIPAFHPWGAQNTLHGNTLYHAPYRVSLRSLVEQLNLMPPEGTGVDEVYYRLKLTEGDPKASLRLYRMSRGNEPYFDSDGEFVVHHDLLDDIIVEVATDAYKVRSSPRYFVTSLQAGSIFVMPPADVDDDSPWSLRINNGSFRIRDIDQQIDKHYFISEFGTQAFDPDIPFRRSVNEEPRFLDRNRLQVAHFPLHVMTDASGKPVNLAVRQNQAPIEVADWVAETGEIILAKRVEFTDQLEVDYTYRLTYLEYTGFYDEEEDCFYHLNLNPLPGHTYTDLADKTEVPSASLLEKDVYIYCLPFDVRFFGEDAPAEPSARQLHSIRHLIVNEGTPEFEVMTTLQSISPHAVLLAKVLVRRTALPESVIMLDSRRRGGGALEELSPAAIQRLAPDGHRFWDTGLWDGEPYPASGVLVATLPESVKEYVSEEEIKAFLEKTVAFGIYPAVRFRPDDSSSP